ncbi:MAG: hypothetical protein CMO30_05650 [Tistrella sp.]|uniref:Iron-containing redox enzyme family protein n=1 Tax=Tistrella mobilis TaxID=171437 RepID=A0A3B9IFF4_9PROT|nr:iron-containing redox enzyme family protein [Tistrella sp.]MAD39016.1 hypothetical protein [Tistrella sp.]MBA74753.1 hypothetical protein [Tistrella sp.]HAE46428.1 hypothetical protein [Tistrella mobilis]
MHIANRLDTQRRLNAFYLREMAPAHRAHEVPVHPAEFRRIHEIEAMWNAYEESRIDLSDLPADAEGFAAWYFEVHKRHCREVAPFFDYIAEAAPAEAMAFYICLEEEVDGRFDDVVALAQLGLGGDMKLALAENFWDEMGNGRLEDMHTVMFCRSSAYMRDILDRAGIDVRDQVPASALKNGNLLLMYALRRRHAGRLLGALTILEHTAPWRFSRTVRGMRRLGMPEDVIHYHDLHIAIDAGHGRDLIRRVVLPLLADHPGLIREVAIGCLIRYRVAVDYYDGIARTLSQTGFAVPWRAGEPAPAAGAFDDQAFRREFPEAGLMEAS